MNEVTRADDAAVRGSHPEPKERRPWETPVLREILIEDETYAKGPSPGEVTIPGQTEIGPS